MSRVFLPARKPWFQLTWFVQGLHPLTEIQDLQLPEPNAQNRQSRNIIIYVKQRQTCNERPRITLNKDTKLRLF